MDNVTTRASVERTVDGMSATFVVIDNQVVAVSIRRMVLAHSPMLQGSSDWTVTAVEIEGGASMLVKVGSNEEPIDDLLDAEQKSQPRKLAQSILLANLVLRTYSNTNVCNR